MASSPSSLVSLRLQKVAGGLALTADRRCETESAMCSPLRSQTVGTHRWALGGSRSASSAAFLLIWISCRGRRLVRRVRRPLLWVNLPGIQERPLAAPALVAAAAAAGAPGEAPPEEQHGALGAGTPEEEVVPPTASGPHRSLEPALEAAQRSSDEQAKAWQLPRRLATDLPIAKQHDEIKHAVEQQRVLVILGGTGCGKSTQVPQYILDEAAASGHAANVLVTQPRRMAAVTLAHRVAEERGEQVGNEIGYRIRGDVVPGRQLSFVTAGYLLSWFTVEPEAFAGVSHIVLDEAHERDAQMELLILLVRLLMRIYPGPRLILMSATVEASFFAQYFAEFARPRGAVIPPLTVGERRFPVELFFLDDLAAGSAPANRGMPAKWQEAARKCMNEVFGGAEVKAANSSIRPRIWRNIEQLALDAIPLIAEAGTTILVFVPGYGDLCRLHSKLRWNLQIKGSVDLGSLARTPDELEEFENAIRQTEFESRAEFNALPGRIGEDAVDPERTAQISTCGDLTATVPPDGFRLFALHSQVPPEDQDLVLQRPAPGICHIVLATTIAESSLTLPEVGGVIDFGVHRTTYSDPSQPGLTQLSTEWCSHSSLIQREGRAGRTRPGWCLRLVPRSFFRDCMPVQPTPEILRIPLTKLFLQAKGISDGLSKAVQEDKAATQRLGLEIASPGALLMQLPAPPQHDAIQAAVHELAQLGVLTEESEHAEVTVLGRIALWLPLDVRQCRLVWLGALWGCSAEAVVIAAACSTPSPFLAPSRLAFADAKEFAENLLQSAESRTYFDGGHFSEPLMCLRLFCSWVRRLALAPPRASHQTKWRRATASLAESAAIDPQKMSIFVAYVADVALRARDMCSDARGENACRVRTDLQLLVEILRRPDLSPAEQRQRTPELPPRVGQVFRAPASKLYALLAAAFSDQLLIGKHKYSNVKHLEPMLNALEGLSKSGIASPNTILIPTGSRTLQKGKFDSGESAKQVVAAICGEEPTEVSTTSAFVACSFGLQQSGVPEVPIWMQDTEPTRALSTHGDQMNMGLPCAGSNRLLGLATRPRLCYMAAGGLRRFTIEDAEFTRAVSPYELQFNLVHSSADGQRLPGVFAEQNPLGFACHITSPEVPLGRDQFACVAANLTLSEAQQAVRANDATLLTAEQLVYALTTLCPNSLKLSLGFTKGLGGDAESTRAALASIKFQSRAIRLTRYLPGLTSVERVNAVRSSMLRALVSGRQRNSHGDEVLLWEDETAKLAIEALVHFVEAAQAGPADSGTDASQPLCWAAHKPAGAKSNSRGRHSALDIQALQPIHIPDNVEKRVARQIGTISPSISHKFECPDCGEQFQNWESCQEHLELTCHADVSSEQAIKVAKDVSQPVRFRCLECNASFFDWQCCKAHLGELGHLDWADESVARLLCLPPSRDVIVGKVTVEFA